MDQTTSRPSRGVAALGLGVVILVAGWGCSGQTEPAPQIDVRLYGWAEPSENAGSGFVSRLAEYPNASQIGVRMTKPNEAAILERDSASIEDGELELPSLAFKEDVRLDFDLIAEKGGRGTRIASGATPVFTPEPGNNDRHFQVMLAPVRDFAPVGTSQKGGAGGGSYGEARFDDRAVDGRYLGRVGHRAVETARGDVLIVGGATMGSPGADGTPGIRTAHDDVQRFQTGSGVVQDLSYDPAAGSRRPGGGDRLGTARAFHTVTSVGDGKFLVVGGYTKKGGSVKPTGSIEVIDLSAEPGNRVTALTSSGLKTPRAHHTATYRPEANQVVVAGGVGQSGNALGSVEIIDASSGAVSSGPTLVAARARHEALLMGGDSEPIWLVGGHDGTTALASTEVLDGEGTSLQSSTAQSMNRPRYDADAARLSEKVVIACGGYKGTTDSPTPLRTCQLGRMGQNQWGQVTALSSARGGLEIVKLTQSKDLAVIGGRNASGSTVREASRLTFQGRSADKLYKIDAGVGSMYKSRYHATVTQLETGMILLTGGIGFTDTSGSSVTECRDGSKSSCTEGALRSLEFYNPGDVVQAK